MKRCVTLLLVMLGVSAVLPVRAAGADPAEAEPAKPAVQADLDPESLEEFRRATDPVYNRLKEIEEELEPIPNLARYKQLVENIENVPTEKLGELKARLSDKRQLAFDTMR